MLDTRKVSTDHNQNKFLASFDTLHLHQVITCTSVQSPKQIWFRKIVSKIQMKSMKLKNQNQQWLHNLQALQPWSFDNCATSNEPPIIRPDPKSSEAVLSFHLSEKVTILCQMVMHKNILIPFSRKPVSLCRPESVIVERYGKKKAGDCLWFEHAASSDVRLWISMTNTRLIWILVYI